MELAFLAALSGVTVLVSASLALSQNPGVIVVVMRNAAGSLISSRQFEPLNPPFNNTIISVPALRA
jgi:hypothetical protein